MIPIKLHPRAILRAVILMSTFKSVQIYTRDRIHNSPRLQDENASEFWILCRCHICELKQPPKAEHKTTTKTEAGIPKFLIRR